MKFKYKARTISGIEQEGNIEAGTQKVAVEMLQKHKLVVVSIRPVRSLFAKNQLLSFIHKVKSQEVVEFSKEFSILLSAGIPLVEALEIIQKQVENLYFKDQLAEITSDVRDGASFSEALKRHSDIFSDLYINLAKAGEASGKMQIILLHLSGHLEKQHHLSSRVKSALLYPAVIITGFGAVALLMMAFVVPKLLEIFSGAEMELPMPTKILIAVSGFFQSYFFLIIIVLLLIFIGFKNFKNTPKGKAAIDSFLLKVPALNKILEKFYMARFSANLSMLTASGVSIIDSLKISGDVVGNEVYKKVVYSAVDEVKTGGSIAYAFEASDAIPPMVSKMISVGEKTGKLDLVLKNISDFYSKEVDIAVEGITAIIEPVLILALGGGVAILVAAILMPIYQMTEAF